MKTFNVPYAKGFVDINIPDQNIAGVLESKAHSYKAELSQEALVEHALDNPIGSQRLEELVKGKSNMVIITSDHTRPVPSKITMPILLRRIREANPSFLDRKQIALGAAIVSWDTFLPNRDNRCKTQFLFFHTKGSRFANRSPKTVEHIAGTIHFLGYAKEPTPQ